MVRWLWFFVKVAVVIAAAVWVANRPGVIAVDWLGWRIETSVGIALLALLVLVVAAVVGHRMWRGALGSPGQVLRWRRRKRRETGLRALGDGMIAVAAGDVTLARQQAKKAAGFDVPEPLKLLLNAQAAQLGGDDAGAARVFNEMLDQPDAAFLGLRGLIAQALREGDSDRALALSDQAYALKPTVPWLVETLVGLRSQAGDWRGAQLVLEEALARKTVTGDGVTRQVSALLMARATDEDDGGADPDAALRQAKRALELNAGLTPAVEIVARKALTEGSPRRARKVLETAWSAAPHPALVALYQDASGGGDSMSQLKAVEKLAAVNPESDESKFAVAEANVDAALWGAARDLLQPLLDGVPTARHYRLMARLEEGEDRPDAVRQWLDEAARAPADPAWVCEACGAAADVWTATCGHCGELAQLKWRPPRRVHQGDSAVAVVEPPALDDPTPVAAISDGR